MSFPETEEEVKGWHLLHDMPVRDLLPGEYLVPDDIQLLDGKYIQLYQIAGTPKSSISTSGRVSFESRLSALESGLAELAEMMINGGR